MALQCCFMPASVSRSDTGSAAIRFDSIGSLYILNQVFKFNNDFSENSDAFKLCGTVAGISGGKIMNVMAFNSWTFLLEVQP